MLCYGTVKQTSIQGTIQQKWRFIEKNRDKTNLECNRVSKKASMDILDHKLMKTMGPQEEEHMHRFHTNYLTPKMCIGMPVHM